MTSPHLSRSALRSLLLAGLLPALLTVGAVDVAGPSAAAAGPRLISYAGGESPGVTVHHRAGVSKLRGAPASFKRFVGDLVARLQRDAGCDAAVGVTVETLRTDGFAVGGVNECGGYAALWAVVDGRWKQVEGAQELWDCRILRRYHFPSDVAGNRCYAYHGDHRTHHYHQA